MLESVQRVMSFMRIMVVSLVLARWLFTSGHCMADSFCRCASDRCISTIAAAQQCKRLSAPCSFTGEHSTRFAARRMWLMSGLQGCPPFRALTDTLPPGIQPVGVIPSIGVYSFCLAKSWQFYWRTASNPRAPSSWPHPLPGRTGYSSHPA
jgi:hypothetical protein